MFVTLTTREAVSKPHSNIPPPRATGCFIRPTKYPNDKAGLAMNGARGANWYRQEAERLCKRAAAIANDGQLRDSYLALAHEYERLAEILEDRSVKAGSGSFPV
jgi:hypothetical protein